MAAFILKANGVDLPAPVSIESNHEILWSSNTGRSTTGKMLGDAIKDVLNVSFNWAYLTEEQAGLIADNMTKGFFYLKMREFGKIINVEGYRGTLAYVHQGNIGDGHYYYKSVTVSFIQR